MDKKVKVNNINKKFLCAEYSENVARYEDFAMKILNKSESTNNIFALTCDKGNFNVIQIVTLNVAHNLSLHNKKVLVINFDTQNTALNKLLDVQNNNEEIIKYNNIDIVLLENTDTMYKTTLDDLKTKYSGYDFIILCVPSPKKSLNYLTVPKNTNFYMLICKFISSFYAINKCIEMLSSADLNVVGSVYVKLK